MRGSALTDLTSVKTFKGHLSFRCSTWETHLEATKDAHADAAATVARLEIRLGRGHPQLSRGS